MERTSLPPAPPKRTPTDPHATDSSQSSTLRDNESWGKHLKCTKYSTATNDGNVRTEEDDLQLLALRWDGVPFDDIEQLYLKPCSEGSHAARYLKICREILQMKSGDQKALEKYVEEMGKSLKMQPAAARMEDDDNEPEVEHVEHKAEMEHDYKKALNTAPMETG